MPPPYQILRSRHLDRDLAGIPAAAQTTLRAAIGALAIEPRPRASKRLQGQRRGEHFRRLRVGDYRVIYDIDDTDLVVRIILAGHRRSVYRIFGRR